MPNHDSEIDSAGLRELSRFSDEIIEMTQPRPTGVILSHAGGLLELKEGLSFKVYPELSEIMGDVGLSGGACTLNINSDITSSGDDSFEVDSVDSAISFIESMSLHYDAFAINTLSTLVSEKESNRAVSDASYKGILSNMVRLHQVFIKIKKPCVITTHKFNGDVYLGSLIKRYANAIVF
tara:strand:+ start:21597 stop:22136 length:540 start_codon:yes stop_codon:yes gene_type:complete